MLDLTKKCKTCPFVDLNNSKSLSKTKLMCGKCKDFCNKHWLNCGDNRFPCKLCANYGNIKKDYCDIDGHFKEENTMRNCNCFKGKGDK